MIQVLLGEATKTLAVDIISTVKCRQRTNHNY